MAKGKARTFGQDLMRGEHVLGESKRESIPPGVTFGEMKNFDGAGREITGTSIFDPVLCELAYRWFCAPGGAVLDPFAGGSVRGIVASCSAKHQMAQREASNGISSTIQTTL